MKRYLIWFLLMMKRMLKKPAFLLLLLVMPIAAVVFTKLENGERTGNVVGIMIAPGEEVPEKWESGPQGESIFTFCFYENKERLIRDVENGELVCGIVLPADLRTRLSTDTWQESIVVYETASGGMTEIVKERVASSIFTLYSEQNYVNYIAESEAFSHVQGTEDLVSFAEEAYESHLTDDSTFAFVYHGDDLKGKSEESELTTSTFRLRGILAVCIFVSGLCGLLTDWKDCRDKRFVRLVPDRITTAVNIWTPVIYTSITALICLMLTGQSAGADSGQWRIRLTGLCKEAVYLLFYQFLIVCYCSIIRLLLRKQEMIAAAVPILTLASLVCCPVFVRIAVYVPAFRILEKLFPATYYLLL